MRELNLIRTKKEAPFVVFRRHGWMVVFASSLLFFSWYSIRDKELIAKELQDRLSKVTREIELSIQEKEDLALQIHSQNDRDWVELTLMRRLGLVPEGQIKAYFTKMNP